MNMRKEKFKFKTIIRAVLDLILLGYGIAYYLLNKKKPIHLRTPSNAYLSMIRLFCLTSGRSNDFLSKCISLVDKPLILPDSKGALGHLTSQDLNSITSQLDKEGYYIFENKLSQDKIKRLYDFALQAPCTPRPLDESLGKLPQKTFYNKNDLKSNVYDICSQMCLTNTDIQELIKDHSIISIAQSYLRSSPKIEPVAFWWSTPFSKKAQSNSAQLFHFDLDRIKWLKFFIFLTDVTIENGPHVFVSKSHKTGGIPYELLKSGYARHEDIEIQKHYSSKDIKTLIVPAGTIVAEDTRGLHKGTNLITGERLVLELQFSNSLFGATSPYIKDVEIKNIQLEEFAKKYPKIFQLYPI